MHSTWPQELNTEQHGVRGLVTNASAVLGMGWDEWHCHAKCNRVASELAKQLLPQPKASREREKEKDHWVKARGAKLKRDPAKRIRQKVVFLHVEKTVRSYHHCDKLENNCFENVHLRSSEWLCRRRGRS